MRNMQVRFISDKEADRRAVWQMFAPDTQDATDRALEAGITEDELAKLRMCENEDDAGEILNGLVERRYEEDAETLAQAVIEYQLAWDKIGSAFSAAIEHATGVPWQFSEYLVVVSLFHRGISNSNANSVIRWAYEDAEDQKRITAHEILMTQLWHIFDQHFSEAKTDPLDHFWALNEITTVLILGAEDKLNKLWTPQTQGVDNFLQNYPQLGELVSILKQNYAQNPDFLSYLHRAVAVIKEDYGAKSLKSV